MDCSASAHSSDPYTLVLKEGYNEVTSENIESIRNSIDSNWDTEYYCVKSCDRFDICEGIINNKGSNDAVALITFAGEVVNNSGWYYNQSSLRNILDDNIGNYGGTGSWRAAVNLALGMVAPSTTDTYRIVIISNTNANSKTIYADEFASNVVLNIVNIGSGSFGNNIEAVAQDTGGDVYTAVNASSLTSQSGGFVYIPEQYVGEDSDGDGIDDNDELGFIIGDLTSDVEIVEYVRALMPHSDVRQ